MRHFPPMQGRLKGFSFETTQGNWSFDVSAVTRAADAPPPAEVGGQPQPPQNPQPQTARDPILVRMNKPPSRREQQCHAESSHARDDDDDFMDPPARRPVTKKQCTNAGVGINTIRKPAKNLVKYPHAPTARCAPSTFNSFVDHLTFNQRTRIKKMGFGGLLRVSAERLGSRELLKFLFARLDPNTMVIDVGKEKGIHVTPFAVKQVLGLPDSGEDLPLQKTHQPSKVLSDFKTLVGLEEHQDLHASHLGKILKDDHDIGSAMIDDDMAIRFFFIIACNKLLFPNTDNNIRCKDVYLTKDLPRLADMNWCKAVVDDLRHAAHTWQVEKTKKETIPAFCGCSILLIILYLDNLNCKHQINHRDTPRAQYFDQDVITKILAADRTKDQQGNTTFGLLPLRNSNNTCYYTTEHSSSDFPSNNDTSATTQFPSILSELGGLVDHIASNTTKMQAREALATFDAKSKQATSYMNMGQVKLQEAHLEVITSLRKILQGVVHGDIGQDHHYQPTSAQSDDVHMHETHTGLNSGSDHLVDKPIGSENREHELHSGVPTNQDIDRDMTMQLQPNRDKEPTLLTPAAIQSSPGGSFHHADNVQFHKEMEDEPSHLCSQVHTDVTIGHVVPPVPAQGDTSPPNFDTGTHQKFDDADSRFDSLVDLIHASVMPSSHPQPASADATMSKPGVVIPPHNQDSEEVSEPNAPMELTAQLAMQ